MATMLAKYAVKRCHFCVGNCATKTLATSAWDLVNEKKLREILLSLVLFWGFCGCYRENVWFVGLPYPGFWRHRWAKLNTFRLQKRNLRLTQLQLWLPTYLQVLATSNSLFGPCPRHQSIPCCHIINFSNHLSTQLPCASTFLGFEPAQPDMDNEYSNTPISASFWILTYGDAMSRMVPCVSSAQKRL